MKHTISSIIALAFIGPVLAQSPISDAFSTPSYPGDAANYTDKPWTKEMHDELVSKITEKHTFVMNPDSNRLDFDDRKLLISGFASKLYKDFLNARIKLYSEYRKEVRGSRETSGRGARSETSVVCERGLAFTNQNFGFEPGVKSRTKNGDWKGGPRFSSDRTRVSWVTGGYNPARTSIVLEAGYVDPIGMAMAELKTVIQTLNQRNIPTSAPALDPLSQP
ncbi:MAG TPA: hypothetical protein VIM57_10925 [Luteolibacter sp.]